jgi:phage terminase small subunit
VTGTSALSEGERIFVDVFIANGGKGTDAALAAGYPEASAHVTACRMLCRKRVADAVLARCQTFMQAALPVAIKALLDIAGDETAMRKDRIKAATSLLEHGGMAAPKGGVQVNVGVQVNSHQAQQLISSVWTARERRLSDIPPAMPDTLQSDLNDLELLAIGPPAPPSGGIEFQGPVAGTGPVPVPSSEHAPKSAVSCECPQCSGVEPPEEDDDSAAAEFRRAFDDGGE